VNQKIEDAVKSFEKNLEHYRKCIEDGNYSSSSSHVYFEKKQKSRGNFKQVSRSQYCKNSKIVGRI
jgi:hypothetical protein